MIFDTKDITSGADILEGKRLVIDTNRLETDELRIFLDLDPRNRAVLTDYTAMEMFKPRTLDAFYASMRVLADRPQQVLVLKGTRLAGTVDSRTGAVSNMLIDRPMTKQFGRFCVALASARAGHPGYRRQLEDRQRWAQTHMDVMRNLIGDMSDHIHLLQAAYSDDELKRYRRREKMTDRMRLVILVQAERLATRLASQHPDRPTLPSAPHLYRHFIWRYALCHLIYVMEMIGKGTTAKLPEKARNDQIDVFQAIYGTYFNGIMTGDRRPMLIHHLARRVLSGLGLPLAEDYMDGYDLIVADEADRQGL